MKQPNLFDGIIVDNFAGGGGASTGIKHIVQYSGGARTNRRLPIRKLERRRWDGKHD